MRLRMASKVLIIINVYIVGWHTESVRLESMSNFGEFTEWLVVCV